MTSAIDDDSNLSVIVIPFEGDEPDEDELSVEGWRSSYASTTVEMDDGPLLRLEAYNNAWSKCLNKVKDILHEINFPVVEKVANKVKCSHTETLEGLPYPEIPVITVTNPYVSSLFMNATIARLESSAEGNVDTYMIDLYPPDCATIMSAMTSIITGFIKKYPDLAPASSKVNVANYDINLLVAWYKYVTSDTDDRPVLVVMIHEFEQFETLVMQDVFRICSIHAATLPITFLLAMSSPLPTSSYLRQTYPHSILVLLRVHQYFVPFGLSVVEQILHKTFFDPSFDPGLALGPAAVESLAESLTRWNPSIDNMLNVLQLTYMKHFMGNISTCLFFKTPTPKDLVASFEFLDHVFTRIQSPDDTPENWKEQDVNSVIETINDARIEFQVRIRKTRLGVSLIRMLHHYVVKCGHAGLSLNERKISKEFNMIIVAELIARGKYGVGHIQKIIKQLRALNFDDLAALVADLSKFVQDLADDVKGEAQDKLSQFTSDTVEDKGEEDNGEVADEFVTWLSEYLKTLFPRLEHIPLWEVWYTGNASIPDKILNPSTRASLLSGLLRPHQFISPGVDVGDKKIWDCPDTSILFQRYLDSGKLVNVYDWFESFRSVLETQKRELEHGKKESRQQQSPRKRKDKQQEALAEEDNEEDDEKWNLEVHARFMRALHELDFMGFIKHTNRKADHVARTVFDLSDNL